MIPVTQTAPSDHMHFSVCVTCCSVVKAFACSQGQSPKTFSSVAVTLLVTHVSDAAD